MRHLGVLQLCGRLNLLLLLVLTNLHLPYLFILCLSPLRCSPRFSFSPRRPALLMPALRRLRQSPLVERLLPSLPTFRSALLGVERLALPLPTASYSYPGAAAARRQAPFAPRMPLPSLSRLLRPHLLCPALESDFNALASVAVATLSGLPAGDFILRAAALSRAPGSSRLEPLQVRLVLVVFLPPPISTSRLLRCGEMTSSA